MEDTDDITRLLHDVQAGNTGASDALYTRLYPELMRLAKTHVSRIGTVSIDGPMLLHEAYVRLVRQDALPTVSRSAFFAYASKVMRSVIVDYIRDRNAAKRGGGARAATLVTGFGHIETPDESVEAIHQALIALKTIDVRAHDVVEMRYFGGLSETEIAETLAISTQTVQRDWRKARAFLHDFMQ
jgi:RNA polymerase sigma factor (TIGR02999 family)